VKYILIILTSLILTSCDDEVVIVDPFAIPDKTRDSIYLKVQELYMKNQSNEAEKLLSTIKPRNAYDHYYFMYAMKVKSALGKYSEAIHFINADMRVSDKPENIAALHFWKADCYGKLGFLDSFIVNINRAIELDSTKYEYYMSRIHYYSVIKQPDMELPDIHRLFRLDSNELDFHSTLALYYSEKGDTLSAIKTYTDVLKKEPGNIWALRSMGIISYLRKDFKNAKKYLEKSIDIDPTDGQVFFFAASTLGYEKNKDRNKMCDYLLKSADLGYEDSYKHLFKCDEYYKKKGIQINIHKPNEKANTDNSKTADKKTSEI
jgi:tetratricopeptide (TPR) repeat protein